MAFWPPEGCTRPRGTRSMVENRLSGLIDRPLAGKALTITRHGQPAVELRPVEVEAGPVRPEVLDWLAARRAGRGSAPAQDAGRLVSEMRDAGER